MGGRGEARSCEWREARRRAWLPAAPLRRWLPALALALAACSPLEAVAPEPAASPSSLPAAASSQPTAAPAAPQSVPAAAAPQPTVAPAAPQRPPAAAPSPQPSPAAAPSPQRVPAATPVPPPTPAPALTARVAAPSVAIAPGASATVDLEASLSSGSLGAWTVDLTYNPAVATLTACTPNGMSVCNPALGTDTVRIVGVALEGLAGTQTLASLTFQAVGAVGASSPLTVTVVDLVDPDGGPIGAAPANGAISVGGAS